MAQLTIEVIQAKRQGGVIHLELLVNGKRLSRDVTASKVDTAQKLAQWVLAQQFLANGTEQALRRQLVIDYHVEEESGAVIDDLTTTRLAEDQAILDIEELPGWASWTGTEASDWIEANVTTLTTAKVALKAMARMLVAEREAIKKLVERGK